MSAEQEKAARAELLKEGEFRDGIFHRNSGEGKKNQDGYEALWERCMGRKLAYPVARYDTPIVLDPRGFTWRPTAQPGASVKRLGVFTERETRLEMLRLEPGAEWTGPAEQAIRLFFVMDGTGRCGGHEYDRHTAIEIAAGERPSFAATGESEIFCLVMPLIGQAARQAA